MKIGLIGCGAMGQGMARNIMKAGHDVLIHDDMSSARSVLESEGAEFTDLETLADSVQHVLISLPSTEIMKDILLGEEGILQHLQPGSLVFDLGTTDVEVTRMFHETAASASIHYLDCPVSGGPAGAAAGTLTILAGGSDDAFTEAEPILEMLGENIVHVGDPGTGQVVKLCNNMIVAGITSLVSETMLTANEYGVSNGQLAELVQQSSGHNKVLDVFGPNLINEEFNNILFYLGHMAKDIELYMNLSKESRVPQYVASTVNQLYRSALRQDKGKLDSTAVYTVISE